jgi:DNA-binding transcriptional ArsR family regulator
MEPVAGGEEIGVGNRGRTSGQGVRGESQLMTVDLIQALDHPRRRRLLRALHSSDEAQSPTQLAKIIGDEVNRIDYHVKFLTRLGVVSKTGDRRVCGVRESFFASHVSNHKQVLSILADTEGEDAEALR